MIRNLPERVVVGGFNDTHYPLRGSFARHEPHTLQMVGVKGIEPGGVGERLFDGGNRHARGGERNGRGRSARAELRSREDGGCAVYGFGNP